ncbi:MAG: S41 family peptidase [Alphaproteobacteria bacterium]|nr:S41 family peptidase [Alphaproteobacteria bacterium]
MLKKFAYSASSVLVGSSILFQTLSPLTSPAFAQQSKILEQNAAAKKKENNQTLQLLELFGDVFDKVRDIYVEPVSDKQLIESAINGMLTSLDPHSGYLDKKAFDDIRVQTRGEFGGLGIEVTMDKGLVKVVSPIDDTPAYNAGIKAGDFISHIDGQAVLGLTLNEAVEKMRGPVKTKVKLTILRENESEPMEVILQREVIHIKSVKSHAEGDIGYVRITSFSEQTFDGLKHDLDKLNKDIGQGKMKGLVLDLRNNPGGLLDQAIAVSDAFLDAGEIVSTRGRTKESIKRFNAHKGDLINGLPMVVLINQGSASASEIVSGALQDHKRAVVMGTKSFGKGSVQTVIPLTGDSAMRLTTSRYYTPSGRSIQAEGIKPDIAVEAAKIEPIDEKFFNSEAQLKGHLSNPTNPNADKAKPSAHENQPDSSLRKRVGDKLKESLDKNGKDKDNKTPDEPVYGKDYQLSRAVDLLRGIAVYKTSNK